ncbi:MAG: hypothetical protein ACRDQ4_02130 [Pseudonocardiaceae bacterium]
MDDFSRSLEQIVEERQSRQPQAVQRRDAWISFSVNLEDLAAAVENLPGEIRSDSWVVAAAKELFSSATRRDIEGVAEAFRAVVSRFSRRTVNVGVSGEARVGKSTLLQSMTGLGNEQIPASSGRRVTAARSMIFHTSSTPRATLTLHSFDSFRQAVLRPYHTELDILPVPNTPDEFARYQYPRVLDLARNESEQHRAGSLLKRLTDMQQAFPTYRDLLTGTEMTIDISRVGDYIAYPPDSSDASTPVHRRYLAVKTLRIDTPFPYAQVERLGVVDLPGRGEVAAEADRHHLEALRDEVDVVLLVKRAAQGLALWRTEEEQTLDLLDEARGAVKSRRDFVFIAINAGADDDPRLIETIRSEVLSGANLGEPDLQFVVLEADARDPRNVFDHILRPILIHLAARLGAMDRDVLDAAAQLGVFAAGRLRRQIHELRSAVTAVTRNTSSIRTDLDRRAEDLRLSIAQDLLVVFQKLQARADDPEDTDVGFRAVVDKAYEGIEGWATSGMHATDQNTWEVEVLRRMLAAGASAGVATQEFDTVRVEVARRYAVIDDYLNEVSVTELLDEVATVLASHLGPTLTGIDINDAPLPGFGRKSLERLASLLEEIPESCPSLVAAVRDLLRLRFEFRSMVYPRIRSELDLLRQEGWNPTTKSFESQLIVGLTSEGAQQMYDFISRRARQVAYRIRDTVVNDAARPAPVLLAAIEIFADTLIRSPQAPEEFRTLVHGYRDEIWPGAYEGVDAANVRVARLHTLLKDMQSQIETLVGV